MPKLGLYFMFVIGQSLPNVKFGKTISYSPFLTNSIGKSLVNSSDTG